MPVVSGTDEGLTSSAKGSRTFEGHSGWSWVVGIGKENSLVSFVHAPPGILAHLRGVLKQVNSRRCFSVLSFLLSAN